MTSALDTLRETKGPGVRKDEHDYKLRRILHLVKLHRTRFTAPKGRMYTGWDNRACLRYLVELGELGLVERPNGTSKGKPATWQLTQAGRDELNALRRGDQTRIGD